MQLFQYQFDFLKDNIFPAVKIATFTFRVPK